MTLTKEMVRQIMDEVRASVEGIGEKHGVDLKFGSARYTDLDFTSRLTVEYVGNEDNKEDIQKQKFIEGALRKGLDLEKYYGKVFQTGTKTFKVVGINTRAPKKFIEIEEVNTGGSYKCELSLLERYLG